MRASVIVALGFIVSQVSVSGFFRAEDFRMALSLESSMNYSSNVELNEEEASDTVFRVQPRIEFSKPEGIVRGMLGVGVAVVRFLDSTENNSNDLVLLAGIEAGEVLGEASPIQVRTEFKQTNDADGFTGELTRRETYGIGAEGRHRFGFGGGAFGSYNYRYLKSRTDGFSDVESRGWQIGGFFQRAADSFALELGFEQNTAQSMGEEDGIESVTNIISAGVRGPLVSTLSGSVRLGVQESESDRDELSGERVPFFQVALDWSYSPLLTVNLSGERRFVTDSSDRIRDQTTLALRLRRQLGGPWQADMGIRYVENRFQEANSASETATVRGVFAGIEYDLAEWGTVRWAVELDDADSSAETFDYQVYRAGIEFSARF